MLLKECLFFCRKNRSNPIPRNNQEQQSMSGNNTFWLFTIYFYQVAEHSWNYPDISGRSFQWSQRTFHITAFQTKSCCGITLTWRKMVLFLIHQEQLSMEKVEHSTFLPGTREALSWAALCALHCVPGVLCRTSTPSPVLTTSEAILLQVAESYKYQNPVLYTSWEYCLYTKSHGCQWQGRGSFTLFPGGGLWCQTSVLSVFQTSVWDIPVRNKNRT